VPSTGGETVDVLDCARRRYDGKRAMLALGSASQCLPGGLFLFCNLCWRFTRQLIPRFLVVRIVVDPVKQLFTARFLCLVRGAFFLLSIGSQIASESEYDRGRGEQLIPTH
jgi:hypothetical protein